MWKWIAVGLWVLISMGFFYLLDFAYDKNKSYWLFLVLIFGCNLVYDIAKSLIRLRPLYRSDWERLAKLGIKALVLFAVSFLGIVADAYAFLPLHLSLLWWLAFYVWALNAFADVEQYYKLMRTET